MYLFNFIDFCYHQHDVVCNQKYNKDYPYSLHLKLVKEQAIFFYKREFPFEKLSAEYVAVGHDLIEDARLTYNDIVDKIANMRTNYGIKKEIELGKEYGKIIADGIYACTESTGRNRAERKDEAYYKRLSESCLGTYIKLCDIYANASWSKLTKSNMFKKYQEEFPKFLEKISNEWKILFAELISAIIYQLEV